MCYMRHVASTIPSAWAQQTGGSVSVIVLDSSGGVVPGATLTLTDVATNEARVRNRRGIAQPRFRLPLLLLERRECLRDL